ncbi:MAG: hypothetical protein HC802_15775 [Caldilineaceae bacterium]|nr:hypothetical protein [Caldilineaceae bacterium]
MIRKLLTLLVLFGVVAWLVLSYVPASWSALPQFSLHGLAGNGLFPILALVGLVVFIVIQLVLIWDTGSWFGSSDVELQSRLRKFELRKGPELFWTGLPLLMTIGLALLSYYEYSF